MRTIYIKFETTTKSLGGQDDNDYWSRNSTESSWKITAYSLEEPKYTHYGYERANVASIDGPIYAVVVDYGTGDSFGNDDGCFCFIDAFSDSDKAHALAKLISADSHKAIDYYGNNNVTYINDEGESVVTATSTWKGYFECFNYCEVVTISTEKTNIYITENKLD